MNENEILMEYCLRLADDRIILGHRLSQLCGHGPILEEDIATTNTALDLLGQAVNLYDYIAELKGGDSNADKLAYFRDSTEYKNILLVEQENIDFAYQMAKQLFYDTYSYYLLEALKDSSNEAIRNWAEKSLKETSYHLRHSSRWFVRLGDGTGESKMRLEEAVDYLWMFTGEMFENDTLQQAAQSAGFAPDINTIYEKWKKTISEYFIEATLQVPDFNSFMQSGGRRGRHSEFLGIILAEMQIVPRTMPDATW